MMPQGTDGTAPGFSDAHRRNLEHTRNNKSQRFPDFILCGQLNLHRSAENAAALSKYIAKQWDFLRINRDGIINSHPNIHLNVHRNI